jgi:hypothetical protein
LPWLQPWDQYRDQRGDPADLPRFIEKDVRHKYVSGEHLH